ncbi:MAG: serine/threonine protein phosphatase [Verrucomicrobia bacterium]|nr:serine/threonine protein phosphatase [Verrucomicrobiota bacterium]
MTLGLGLSILTLFESACGQVASQQPGATPPAQRFTPSAFLRFADWKAACSRLPGNRALKHTLPPKELRPLKTFAQFAEPLEAFFDLCKTGAMSQADAWVGEIPAKAHFFNTDAAYFVRQAIPFQPFAQRHVVPLGAEVIFHGDFHGDIHSMIAWLAWLNERGYLQDFRLARPNTYLVLLGDYTDRGGYGVEVLYTILRLKLENPDRVLLARGNHEDISLASRYGFLAEGSHKFGREFNAQRVLRLYDFLPVVLYLGCADHFIQCNHGGMEPGFDPGRLLDAPEAARFELLGPLKQTQFAKAHSSWVAALPPDGHRIVNRYYRDFLPASPTTPTLLGFMWNDFSIVRGETEINLDPDRGFVYGEGATRFILEQAGTATRRVHAVFRAHQHSSALNPMMRRLKATRGIFRHWQERDSLGLLDADPSALTKLLESTEERRVPANSVWTFNVSPDSVYGDGCEFSFDSFGILTTAQSVNDWKLRVVNLTIAKCTLFGAVGTRSTDVPPRP